MEIQLKHNQLQPEPEILIFFKSNMTGCCILGCSNKSEGGFYMKRFPTDLEKIKVWVENIGRKNWAPKQYSTICEVSK